MIYGHGRLFENGMAEVRQLASLCMETRGKWRMFFSTCGNGVRRMIVYVYAYTLLAADSIIYRFYKTCLLSEKCACALLDQIIVDACLLTDVVFMSSLSIC